jgi:hypothetical protein
MMMDKICAPILKFLDNKTVMLAVSIILILLVSTVFGNINHSIRMFASNKLVRLIWVLLIVCVATKHMCLALLLGLLYVVSIGGVSEFFANSVPQEEKNQQEQMKKEREEEMKKEKEEEMKKDKEEQKFTNQGDVKKEAQPKDMLVTAMDTLMAPFQTETKEDFIPFFMTNKDFESGYESSLKGSSKKGCLATDPNLSELVGDACKPVAVFEGELNAQGMNDITGFNINNNMTAQPL